MAKNLSCDGHECYTLLEEVELGEGESLPPEILTRAVGKLGHAGRVTENGRLYSREIISSEIDRISPMLEQRAVHGLSGHPNPGSYPDPDKEAFVLNKLWMNEDGGVYGELDVLNVPSGQILSTKIKAGVQVCFSSRGSGSAKTVKYSRDIDGYIEDNAKWVGKPVQIVNNDYRLITYDHVVQGAITDAKITSYREDIEMFDIEKLSEDEWKLILDSERVKTKMESVEISDEDIQKKVREYMESDKFANYLETQIDETNDGDGVVTVKCENCESDIIAESKFCAMCGYKVKFEEAKTTEEKDLLISELRKEIDSYRETVNTVSAKLEAIEENNKQLEESAKIKTTLDDVMTGVNVAVANLIRTRYDEGKIVVTADDAEAVFKAEIAHYTSLLETVGSSVPPPGVATVAAMDEQHKADGPSDVGVQILDTLKGI